jgi:hypothetical protein
MVKILEMSTQSSFNNLVLICVSVKATSVIFFLGVGGFVCYKLYHYYCPPKDPPDSPDQGSVSRKAFSTGSTFSSLYQSKRQLLDPTEEAPFGSVQVRTHSMLFLPLFLLF